MILIYLFCHGLAPRAGMELWPHTLAAGIAGDIVALAGLVIVLWARTALGGNWSSTVVIKENHEFVTRGPYAVVRHPIYGGVLLMILGLAIDYGHLAWFVVFCCCLVGLSFKAQFESGKFFVVDHARHILTSMRREGTRLHGPCIRGDLYELVILRKISFGV
jgi:protein-S-isoprenylcysteine O-methyltransferase Ste14